MLGRAVETAGEPPGRSRRRRWLGIELVIAADGVLLLATLAAGYGELDAANIHTGRAFPNLTLLFLAATLTGPLLLRDRRPRLAWVFSTMAMLWTVGVARDLLDAPFTGAGVVVSLYCLYTLAARSDRRVTAVAWGVSIVLGIAFAPGNLLGVALLVTAPTLLGLSVHARHDVQRELAEQAHRHQEERAVLEERQRIARELHDVVAHHMSVIAIHAEAAPYKVERPPAELAESFADIRAAALEGLTELRRILGVLRTVPDAPAEPQPGLERLDDVVASARSGGLDVETSVTGEPPAVLPQGIGLSAYRILQESLSNVMRHAPGAAVRVEIGFAAAAVRLGVVNGPAPAGREVMLTGGGGHGLVGMRERVAMLDGRLEAGPTPDGGFSVIAVLPLEGKR